MPGAPGRLQRCNCGHVNNVVPLGAAREIGHWPREALKYRSQRLRTAYAEYLTPVGDGAIGTIEGYSDVPSMWLWFRLESRSDGLTLIFTSASLAEGPLEEEDDT